MFYSLMFGNLVLRLHGRTFEIVLGWLDISFVRSHLVEHSFEIGNFYFS